MMKKIRSGLKLYGHFISINVRSMMQYKLSFFLSAFGQFLVSFNVFLGVYFMLQRFHNVRGFSLSEILLGFSVVLLSFSLAEMFFRGFDAFPSMVKTGSFDQVLVRPRNIVLQVLGSKFELTRIGRFLQAVVMAVYGISHAGIRWTFPAILTLVFMVIGGFLVFSGLFMIYAGLCFFTLEGLEFMNVFTDGAREFGKYPIGVYGEKILLFSTFIIPYALFQYYPLLFILGRKTSVFYMFLPLVGGLFILPCIAFWRFSVRHYQSGGS